MNPLLVQFPPEYAQGKPVVENDGEPVAAVNPSVGADAGASGSVNDVTCVTGCSNWTCESVVETGFGSDAFFTYAMTPFDAPYVDTAKCVVIAVLFFTASIRQF